MSSNRDRSNRGRKGYYNGNYDGDRTVNYAAPQKGGHFKSRGRVKRNVGNFHPRSDRYLLGDDDISMEGGDARPSTSKNRHAPYNTSSRGSYRGPRSNRKGRGNTALRMARMDDRDNGVLNRLGLPVSGNRRYVNMHSASGWFKITIPYGAKHDKTLILQSLTELSSSPFSPVQVHNQGTSLNFYVNDAAAAKSLRESSRVKTLPGGYKLIVSVTPCPSPNIFSEENLNKIKVAMSNRYDPSTKTLNLSNMASCEELKKEKIFVSVARYNIAQEVLRIIADHIPELEILDLSDNRLVDLSNFKYLHEKAPNIKALNLRQNSLKSVDELHKVKDLKNLVELCLEANTLVKNYADKSSYISAVRGILPKVLKLDGHDLPPPILFEEETSEILPPIAGNRFPNDQVQALIVQFLQQYYQIFDSDNRRPLLAAYHDDAVFSLATFYNPMIDRRQTGFGYLMESRNGIRIQTDRKERLRKQLKVGNANILTALDEFPKTTHDLSSLVVDTTLTNEHLMQFVVTGIFREESSKSIDPTRSFSRIFVTVPSGTGIAIVNEQFTITNTTEKQSQKAFKVVAAATPSSPPQASGITPEQQAMVTEFVAKSGMNAEFSMKCLSECGWDFNRSAAAFAEAKEKGIIPADAFAK